MIKKFFKNTPIGKIWNKQVDKLNKNIDSEFESTFLKMEGKSWDQYLKEQSDKKR